jgi:hypothetical protein
MPTYLELVIFLEKKYLIDFRFDHQEVKSTTVETKHNANILPLKDYKKVKKFTIQNMLTYHANERGFSSTICTKKSKTLSSLDGK